MTPPKKKKATPKKKVPPKKKAETFKELVRKIERKAKTEMFEDRLRKIQRKRKETPPEPPPVEPVNPVNDPIIVTCSVCTQKKSEEEGMSLNFIEPVIALSLQVAVGGIGSIDAQCPGCGRVFTLRSHAGPELFSVDWIELEPDTTPERPRSLYGAFMEASWLHRWIYRRWLTKATNEANTGNPNWKTLGPVAWRQAIAYDQLHDPDQAHTIGTGWQAKLAAEELREDEIRRYWRGRWEQFKRRLWSKLSKKLPMPVQKDRL